MELFWDNKTFLAMNLNINADPESDSGYVAALTGLLFITTLCFYILNY